MLNVMKFILKYMTSSDANPRTSKDSSLPSLMYLSLGTSHSKICVKLSVLGCTVHAVSMHNTRIHAK